MAQVSPAPTPPPHPFIVSRKIYQRQFVQTCGWIDGDISSPATCNTGSTCASNTINGVHFCCTDVSNCVFPTACLDQTALVGCDASCSANASILKCSQVGLEYCYTRYWNDRPPLSGFACAPSPFTQTIETTYEQEDAIQARSTAFASATSGSVLSFSNQESSETSSATSDSVLDFFGDQASSTSSAAASTVLDSSDSASSSSDSILSDTTTRSQGSVSLSASTISPTSSSISSSSPSSSKPTGLSGGDIAAIAFGGIVLVLIGFLSWLLRRWFTRESRERRRQERERLRQDRLKPPNGAPSHISLPSNPVDAPSELSPSDSASHHGSIAASPPTLAPIPSSQVDSRPPWSVINGGFHSSPSAPSSHPTNMSPRNPPSQFPFMPPWFPPQVWERSNATAASDLHPRRQGS